MRNKVNKNVFSGLLIFCMAVAMFVAVGQVKAANTEETSGTHNIVASAAYDGEAVQKYRNGTGGTTGTETYPAYTEDGYLFAGWFTTSNTAEMNKDTALSATETAAAGTSYYAKFVPAHIADVKAQLTTNLTSDTNTDGTESGDIRFLSTVESLDYQKVGFRIQYNYNNSNKDFMYDTSKVYTTVEARENSSMGACSYNPAIFCEHSEYFTSYTITNVPDEAYMVEFSVTPYWVTLDGTTVTASTVIKMVEDGVEAKIRDGDTSTYYTSLENAVTAAKTANTATVTLLCDAEVETAMTIESGDSITVTNKAGKTVTVNCGKNINDNSLFTVNEGGTLAITGVGTDKANNVWGLTFDGRTVKEAEANKKYNGDDSKYSGRKASVIKNSGTLTLSKTRFCRTYQSGQGAGGAVLHLENDTMTKINTCKFDTNKAYRGGAIGVTPTQATTMNMELTECDFDSNISTANGGALSIHFNNNAIIIDATVEDCTFTNNTATTSGGAIYVNGADSKKSVSNLKVENTNFVLNSSKQGGAIYAEKSLLTVTGTNNQYYFKENTGSKSHGGAIFVVVNACLTVTDYNFINNTATDGASIRLNGDNRSLKDKISGCKFTGTEKKEISIPNNSYTKTDWTDNYFEQTLN